MAALEAVLKPGFVDFRDYFGLFSILFAGVISTSYINPRKKNRKIAPKEPENRQNQVLVQLLGASLIAGGIMEVANGAQQGEKPYYVASGTGQPVSSGNE